MHSTFVIVVSASPALRTRIRQALEAVGVFEVPASLATFKALVDRPHSAATPMLVLVDAVELDAEPRDAIAQLYRRYPRARLVAILAPGGGAQAQAHLWMAHGASDAFASHARDGGISAFERWASSELIPRLASVLGTAAASQSLAATQFVPRAERAETPRAALPAASPTPPMLRSSTPTLPPEVLLVASSTGGPNALAEFFGAIPQGFPLPVAVVQHMPPRFTRIFADRLDQTLELRFLEARGGEILSPGVVFIAPGDHHLVLVRDGEVRVTTALDDGPPECSCRPAADVLFRSAARVFGGRALAVVLTGMGQDGYAGSLELADEGAPILAQDEASSVVWGMPGKIVQSSLASFIGPPAELAREVLRRTALVHTRRTS